jgi:hypothetical protein
MKLGFLLFTMICLNLQVAAQAPDFAWARKWSTYTAFDIATDDQGNVYTLSSGSTQVNFNPTGAAIMGPTPGCGAISKFDSNGNLIWVKFITRTGGTGGSCEPKRLFIKGNYLYYAGEFGDGGGTYDFNLSNTATYNVGGGCNGCGIQVFVSKIDLDGNFQWFTAFGQYATVNDIYVDNADNVFLAGGFRNGISSNSQSVLSNGDRDAYLMKLNPFGLCQWVKSLGSNNSFSADEMGVSVKVNSLGEIIFVGNFEGTVDIDPGPITTTITSMGFYEAFVLKLSASGNLLDYRIIGGTSAQRIEGLEIAPNDDIILTGVFEDSTDFDLSLNQNFSYAPIFASYIVKYSSQFNLQWVRIIQSASSLNLTVDSIENIYTCGTFNGTVDFDPTSGVSEHSSGIGGNTYILKLGSQGSYIWSGILQTGSNTGISGQYNEPYGMHTVSDEILISGAFASPVDFDPGPGVFTMTSMTSPNGYSQYSTAFILKLNQCVPTSSIQNVLTCNPYTAPDGQIYSQSGTYTSNLVNAAGCDSVVTINLNIAQPSTATLDTLSCGAYTTPSGNVWTTNGTYLDTIPNALGCDSILTINLTINTIDTTITKNGNTLTANQQGATYQWYNCTTNSPISGATNQSFTASSPGWYAVMVTTNGCSEMTECIQVKKIIFPPPGGIAEVPFLNEEEILLYPNPFNNYLMIDAGSLNIAKITLYDLEGRKVIETNADEMLNLEFLASGTYQLSIETDAVSQNFTIVKL